MVYHKVLNIVSCSIQCVHVCSVAKLCLTLCDPMDCQGPLSMGFPRQEYWNGLPFSPPGDLPDPGIKPVSPALVDGFFVSESVQFTCSVVSDSLWLHESQHARPPCPSPTPRVHSDPCPLSPWCHPAISSSVILFPPAPNPSQHQSLFQWVNSSHEVAKVLEFQL